MRRLVICCDGTWNDPSSNTNVYRLHSKLAATDQLSFYDPGVGASSVRSRRQNPLQNLFDRIGGGAFGAGLSGNVQEAYRWIAETYEEGDSLWFFGFSRGAFTVRSTVGWIRKTGLLRWPVSDEALEAAHALYRKRDATPDTPEAMAFRREHNTRPIDSLDIAFLGVWDTVGALGIPGALLAPITRRRWGFHDYRLSSHVKRAYQALAADELRAAYLAALWRSPVDPGQEVEQRWFPGHHSDIGGKRGDIALQWLAKAAQDAGLRFDEPVERWPSPGAPRARPLELTSRRWRLLCGQALRPIGDSRFAAQSIDASLETLHATNERYRPENLKAWLDGTPLGGPVGRRWWYTLPGVNEHYIRQYDAVLER